MSAAHDLRKELLFARDLSRAETVEDQGGKCG
jgi:hypothetical protein